jgi:hypothetical protein
MRRRADDDVPMTVKTLVGVGDLRVELQHGEEAGANQ